mmetsp:Transcript_11358/g.26602  ORF Transcript_11358/g.26602 Transcript_11358/m.26602 type:complete len:201 (-) Transcript_11358:1824-2426(-)
MARCLPSSLHSAAMPSGLPLGLNGYSCVTSFESLTYRRGARFDDNEESRTVLSGKWKRPSPCATQTPRDEPAMPLSSTDGPSTTLTLENLLSNLPLSFSRRRGCLSSGRPSPLGIQPSSAMSWQPLHTPRLNVSFLFRKSSNCFRTPSLNLMTPAQPLPLSRTSAYEKPPTKTTPRNPSRVTFPPTRSETVTSHGSSPAA